MEDARVLDLIHRKEATYRGSCVRSRETPRLSLSTLL